MGSREQDCGNCIGLLGELCDLAYREEAGLIKMLQVMDADDVEVAQKDPTVAAEDMPGIEEAAQMEAVHLFDHRAAELNQNMDALGCVLALDAVKEKLKARMAG